MIAPRSSPEYAKTAKAVALSLPGGSRPVTPLDRVFVPTYHDMYLHYIPPLLMATDGQVVAPSRRSPRHADISCFLAASQIEYSFNLPSYHLSL